MQTIILNDISKLYYSAYIRLIYHILLQKVRLIFDSTFGVQAKDETYCFDYVKVSWGSADAQGKQKILCGTSKPDNIDIPDNTFTIVFRADRSTALKGFKVKFIAVNSESDTPNEGSQQAPSNSGKSSSASRQGFPVGYV